jgi:hypothetical protein
MIRFLLSLFRPFRGFIEASGADYEQFIQILKLKLTLDDRKQSRKKGSSTEQSLILQSVSQIAIGLVFSIISMQIPGEFTFYYIMHTIIMVMMAMMIISEFTTILFDTSENSIIQPLPIKGNTVSLARSAHVFLYLSLIAINISLATLVIGIVKFGIVSGLLFLVSVFMNVLFTLFLANILYLGLMHVASGEQLKNVLMYFQIVIAVVFMAGYQFGLNMVDKTQLGNMMMHVEWYTYLIPSAVFAGFVEGLSSATFHAGQLLFIAEAIILPLAAVFVTSRYLTPVFNRKLLNLESSDRATKVKSGTGKTTAYYRLMERLHTHSAEEKASFQLAWRMSGYERLFKQSFFPSLAYVLIMIAVQFFKDDINLAELAASNRYFVLLYSFMLISFTLTNSLLLGTNQHADWIFKILPVSSPAHYFKGFIKAVFARFFSPFYVVMSLGIIAFWGVRVIPDVIIAWMVIYMSTLLMFYMQQPDFPFTQAKAANQGGKTMVKVFGLMIMAGLLGWMHFLVIKWEIYGQLLLFLLYAVGIFSTNRYLAFKIIKWNKIDMGS